MRVLCTVSCRRGRLSNPESGTGIRPPLLGRIKVGMKAKNAQGKEYPSSIDWFRADGKYAATFHRVYGEKPTKIQQIQTRFGKSILSKELINQNKIPEEAQAGTVNIFFHKAGADSKMVQAQALMVKRFIFQPAPLRYFMHMQMPII